MLKSFFSLCYLAGILIGSAETIDFNADWKFLRGDRPGAEQLSFDDSDWRTLDLPHDWSIEDLPAQDGSIPELEAVAGEWRFMPGDQQAWSQRDFDDTAWSKVTLPDAWENHGQSDQDNVYGWYRRTLEVPQALRGKDLDLLLGKIDDVDETWVNGTRIGGTGSFPPQYHWADEVPRRYRVPASLVGADGLLTLAVRVFDGANRGGILAAGTPSERVGPFDPVAASNRHFTGFTVGGTGWYRKSFTLPEKGQRVAVIFDGIYMNSEVWINGHSLGDHPHGYTGFELDLSPFLNPSGEPNVLAVKVRNEGQNSRWYSGSGIYRSVQLRVTHPVHIPTWGTFVTTPTVTPQKAVVRVSAEITNGEASPRQLLAQVRILDPAGKSVGSTRTPVEIRGGETHIPQLEIAVPSPLLWTPDSPHLYTAVTEILDGNQLLDAITTVFGIRSIEVDARRGFLLNGQPLLLRGGCIHHDNGPLGALALARAEERKVELLKAQGFNALRSSHNPPSTALLDACDRLGLLVIDEAFDQWNEPKENNLEGHQRFFANWHARDLAAMVRRDRNHPSVIMWSVGNEIPEQFRAPEIGPLLRKEVLQHDTTRPLTQAFHRIEPWDEVSKEGFHHLDVVGYNYLSDKYESDHRQAPDRIMLGTESYPKEAFNDWSAVEQHPYVIGDFVWTAFDYLGEAGLAHSVLSNEANPFFMGWPWTNAWSGDLDLCGFKKPQSYYRDVLWNRRDIALFVHDPIPAGLTEVLSGWAWPKESENWNPREEDQRTRQISVYSRCEKVRLELNGRTVGEQRITGESKLTAHFEVPYEPGELKAIGLRNGRPVAETRLVTTGKPAAIRLVADRSTLHADRQDLSYVTVEVVDDHGRRVPDARISIHFSVTGEGELAGQANARPHEPASFQQPSCITWQGRCLAIIRPQGNMGEIQLSAEADGLKSATLSFEVKH
ncbi:beta-galactosidase [Haloferula luteola]|uniref:Beta-galactosidase n=1 Tax=Haloferula luteola TaxID=595692 RepID=A0A840UYH8_9BACT|nr:sugar-binding domain-containing protein [Haloferula luteola]MBB5350053.1 beta-galactosidase [Haloferula luteola]